MLAYKNDKKLKTAIIKEMNHHKKLDAIIKGTYGKENGIFKGCAVGCAIQSLNIRKKKTFKTDDHSVYEMELGIPRALAYLEDVIFEHLPNGKAQDFAVNFLDAISVGSDLRLVVPKFMVWLRAEEDKDLPALPDGKEFETLKKTIYEVTILYQRIIDGGTVSDDEWTNAAQNIETARNAALAAWAAWDALAAWAAWDARAARDAWAAWDARAARDAWAAWAAWDARAARAEKSADKILSLLREAK